VGAATKARLDELEAKKHRVLAALVRLRAGRVFNAYIRLWAVAQLVELLCAEGAGASTRWEFIQMAFAAASLVTPWRARVVVAGALHARIVAAFFKLPAVSNADINAVFFDSAVLLCVAGHVTGVIATWPRVVDAIGRAVRSQLAWLYVVRGFWKVNTSFLNPATSCAPILVIQLLDAYAPAWMATPQVASAAGAPTASSLFAHNVLV